MVDIKMFKKTIALFNENDFNYWVYGGFALEGLRGKITREHQDVDIYLDSVDINRMVELLSSQDFNVVKRESMYFAELGETKIGILLIDFVGEKIIANGNVTLAKYPREIFGNDSVVSLDGFSFRIVPNEVICLEAKFSKHEVDKDYAASLNYNKDLFEQIETIKIRESRSVEEN